LSVDVPQPLLKNLVEKAKVSRFLKASDNATAEEAESATKSPAELAKLTKELLSTVFRLCTTQSHTWGQSRYATDGFNVKYILDDIQQLQ